MFRTYRKFWKAAAEGDVKTLADYLKNGGKFDIDWRGSDGRTALHLAADNDQPEAVNILLRFGAKTEAKDSAGRTPQANLKNAAANLRCRRRSHSVCKLLSCWQTQPR